MPHSPEHRVPATAERFRKTGTGKFFDLQTGELISPEEREKRGTQQVTTRQFGQAEDIISQRRGGLLESQKTQFEQSRRSFQERLNLALGGQVGQARRGFVQSAARRGLTGSGVEQAGVQAVRAAGQQQFALSLGEFETKLSLAQESQLAQFDQRSFDFLARIATMAAQADFEKDMMRFQAQLAADAASAERITRMLESGSAIATLVI